MGHKIGCVSIYKEILYSFNYCVKYYMVFEHLPSDILLSFSDRITRQRSFYIYIYIICVFETCL